jgi:membrane protein DedA with SNARE-associated domain
MAGVLVGGTGLGRYLRQAPPLTRAAMGLVFAHKALGIFAVIGLEEMGVPVPIPGDLAILLAGHLVARRRLALPAAFAAIVLGSVAGSSVLFWLSRRYGQPFIRRYGPYMHIKQRRLDAAERGFRRWGFMLIVVGRHVPGMRMVISVFAGVFGVSWPVFVSSVALSSTLWAAIFLALGYGLDGRIGQYLTLTPWHLLPSTLFLSGSLLYGWLLHRRATASERAPARPLELQPEIA